MHGLFPHPSGFKAHVETFLRRAGLRDEVKDDLHRLAGTEQSGGRPQRLCSTRAPGTLPDVLPMDEPTGSTDPIATARAENRLSGPKADHARVIATHSQAQAACIAGRVACFHPGRLPETGATGDVFTNPQPPQARAFPEGRTG